MHRGAEPAANASTTASAAAPSPAAAAPSMQPAGYQALLTGLLSLNFGLVLFDRNALNFLMPFVQPELGLDNTEVGVLTGALSLTWAVAALGISAIVDRHASRKQLLVLCTLAFSACSFGSGLATSFAMLLAARLMMGLAEGGIMPVSQALIASEVSPRHRGLAMGVAQGFGSSLMGSFVAPVVLVAFATAFGWRQAFFLAGVPGVLVALVLAWTVRPPARLAAPPASSAGTGKAAGTASFLEVLVEPNVLRCVVLGVLLVSYLVVTWAFLPLYLTQVRGYDPTTMSWLMGALGISATIASTGVPALSDRIGRRPLMIGSAVVGALLPLAALFFGGSAWLLAALFFVGWSVTGAFPLFMATVPSESVAPHRIPLALGLCMGISEILGGVLSPVIAGVAADRYGLAAPVWMLLGLTLLGAAVAAGIRETAPCRNPSALSPTEPRA
jgi:MFS transporter, ACS family, hexuronate transporter